VVSPTIHPRRASVENGLHLSEVVGNSSSPLMGSTRKDGWGDIWKPSRSRERERKKTEKTEREEREEIERERGRHSSLPSVEAPPPPPPLIVLIHLVFTTAGGIFVRRRSHQRDERTTNRSFLDAGFFVAKH